MNKGWKEFQKLSVIVLILLLYFLSASALMSKDFVNIIISIIVLLIGIYIGYSISGKKSFKKGYKTILVTSGILWFISSFVFFNGYDQLTIIENLDQIKVKNQPLILANPWKNNIIRIKQENKITGTIIFSISKNKTISWRFKAKLERVADYNKVLNMVIKFGSTQRWQKVVEHNLKIFVKNEIPEKPYHAFFSINLRNAYQNRLHQLGYRAASITVYNPKISMK